jgi:alpha-galactosidase
VEIESCASGGGRIDLEVLTRTDRVWPSDTVDALERQRIQRWTSLLVPPEREELAAWVALHKRIRPVLTSGRVVRGDDHDPAVVVSGVVAPDGAEGWYVVAICDTVVTQAPPPVLLPGLDPDRTYLLSVETPAGDAHAVDLGTTWLDGEPVEVAGVVLTTLGVLLPTMAPETAVVLRAQARP